MSRQSLVYRRDGRAGPLATVFDAMSGADDTEARSINAAGEIAGRFDDDRGRTHGFLRTPDGQITQLDFPKTSGGTAAYAINKKGEVAGTYVKRTAAPGFLLKQ
jgi:uncharacterized membrane protein